MIPRRLTRRIDDLVGAIFARRHWLMALCAGDRWVFRTAAIVIDRGTGAYRNSHLCCEADGIVGLMQAFAQTPALHLEREGPLIDQAGAGRG